MTLLSILIIAQKFQNKWHTLNRSFFGVNVLDKFNIFDSKIGSLSLKPDNFNSSLSPTNDKDVSSLATPACTVKIRMIAKEQYPKFHTKVYLSVNKLLAICS